MTKQQNHNRRTIISTYCADQLNGHWAIGNRIVGFTDRQRIPIHTKGWVNLVILHGFNETEFTKWIMIVEKRTFFCNGSQFDSVAMKKFQALNYWVKNLIKR